jgi:hypothetical protein
MLHGVTGNGFCNTKDKKTRELWGSSSHFGNIFGVTPRLERLFMLHPIWLAPFLVLFFIVMLWALEKLFVEKMRGFGVWLALVASVGLLIPSLYMIFNYH